MPVLARSGPASAASFGFNQGVSTLRVGSSVANTTTSTYLVATSALGVVTLTCKQPGLIGNAIGLIVTENTGSSIVPSAASLASGTNGTVSTLSFGL
jgi:phage tail sheath gpL-like